MLMMYVCARVRIFLHRMIRATTTSRRATARKSVCVCVCVFVCVLAADARRRTPGRTELRDLQVIL